MKRFNTILYVLIVVGLISSLAINWQRHQIERVNRQVEMLMDYEDLLRLAANSGKSNAETLQDFKTVGVTSLAIYEDTIEKLVNRGQIAIMTGADIINRDKLVINNPAWTKNLSASQLNRQGLYVIGNNDDIWHDFMADAKLRFNNILEVQQGNSPVIFIPGSLEAILTQDLGLSKRQIQEVAAAGFNVTVRPTNYQAVTSQDVKAVFERIDAAGVPVTTMLFSAKQSLGVNAQLEETARQLKARNIILAMTEHPTQLQFAPMQGLTELAKMVNYNVARLYVIDKEEQQKRISIAEAVRRFPITDEERNIRINFLRTFDKADYDKTLYQTNIDYIKEVAQKVQDRDFTLGKSGVFAPYFPNKLLFIPIILGASAAGVLYLSLFLPLSYRNQSLMAIVIAVILSIPILMGAGTTVRQAVALVSAVVFPSLSMIYIINIWDKAAKQPDKSLAGILSSATWQITLAVILSLVGGMYLAAILGDIRFFLEIDIYRGVKVTFILPILLVSFYYIYKHNIFAQANLVQPSLLQQIQGLFNQTVYVRTMIIAMAVMFVAWVFIGRSGHSAGVPVPAIEVKLRVFLEEVMYARPREKEFMVGHVAFFLAALATYKHYPRLLTFAFVTMASIGQGSLVQTFAHMRTPVIMSVVRAIDGWALGIVCAIVVTVIFNFMYPYMKKIESELHPDA